MSLLDRIFSKDKEHFKIVTDTYVVRTTLDGRVDLIMDAPKDRPCDQPNWLSTLSMREAASLSLALKEAALALNSRKVLDQAERIEED